HRDDEDHQTRNRRVRLDGALMSTRTCARDEHGSVLIITLVMIIVVAVMGAAVLRQESSAPNAQKAYATVRDAALTADGLADQTIQQYRYDSTAAVDNHGPSNCDDRGDESNSGTVWS